MRLLAIGAIGLVALFFLFPRYQPSAKWTVLPRETLIEKAREIAQHFRVNSAGKIQRETIERSKALERYALNHKAEQVAPLSLRLRFASAPDGHFDVGVDSAGHALYWKAPENTHPVKPGTSDEEAAHAAFIYFAGSDASSYQGPSRSAGDESHEEQYVWKTPHPDKDAIRRRIKVVVKRGALLSVTKRVNLSGDEEDDQDSEGLDSQSYWNVFTGLYGILTSVSVAFAIGFSIVWLVKRSVNIQLALRMSLVFYALLVATEPELDAGTFVGEIFVALLPFCLILAGRSISVPNRSKWNSLEQLFALAPLSKNAGVSVLRGLCVSPWLVAVPFVIAALLPGSYVLPYASEILYSRHPLLGSIAPTGLIVIIGAFGFAWPALERLLRRRVAVLALALPLATLFFADQPRVAGGSIAAPLLAGLATFLLNWLLYRQFDLLAILTLNLAAIWFHNIFLLAQKGLSTGLLVPALLCVTAAAIGFILRGKPESLGDPRANNPTLVGFRAEREKLRAQLSVARRAQQEMLPPTPQVEGYTLAASCTPSLDVGGDLYEFLKLPDGRLGIGVADVSGKGVPAALYMTLTKGLLASVTRDNSQLSAVMDQVNRHLHSVTRKKVFVTMALAFLDTEKRVLECVRAGHNPIVWRRPALDSTTLIAPAGLGLGITGGRIFGMQLKVEEMALAEGDAVVFYSDGITEAMNSELELFGEERLMNAVERADSLDAAATAQSILSTVQDFLGGVHPQDDMTLVVLRVGAG